MVKNFDTSKMHSDVARLYRTLIRSGLSMTQFAKLAKVSRQSLYPLLNGDVSLTPEKQELLNRKERQLVKCIEKGYLPATGETLVGVIAKLNGSNEVTGGDVPSDK